MGGIYYNKTENTKERDKQRNKNSGTQTTVYSDLRVRGRGLQEGGGVHHTVVDTQCIIWMMRYRAVPMPFY